MTSTEVDGACSSRLTGVNGGGGGAEAKQVDCLEDPVDDPPEATPSGTTTTPPVVGASAAGAKPSQGGTTSSSSSLHRVADKLKEKLNRQMLNDEDQNGEPVSGLKKESTNNNNNNNHVQKSGSETRSQYHSILKLSSPSSKSFAAAAVSRSFSPSNQNSFDFSSSSSTTGPRYHGHHAPPPPELYPPGVADTLDVLRGMIKGPEAGGGGGGLLLGGGGGGRKDLASYGAQADQSKMIGCYAEYEDGGGGGGGGENAFAKSKYSSYLNNSDDDESLFQSDTLGDSVISADEFSDRDFSCRKGNYGNSRSSSLSSEKHLNHHHRGRHGEEEEEDEEEEDGRGEEDEEEEEGGAGNNCVEDSFCSDWSPGNRIEAKKKARVENIISNMRPSPNGKTTSASASAAAAVERREDGEMLDPPTPIAAANGLLDARCLPAAIGGQSTEVRRPKRKQYIPQQHDARESEEADEPPAAKVRKVEKDAMHQQLQRMQEQLNEMQQRCFQLIDNDQSFDDDDDDDDYADDDNNDEEDEDEERKGDARLIVGRLRSDLNRNEIQRLSNGILQTLRGDDGKELIERATRQIGALPPPLPPSSSSSSSDAAGRMSGLRHLATLLKAEITTSVGMLVDGIVKNFMAKHFDANDNNKEAAVREPSKSPKTMALEPLSLREPAQFKQQRDEPFLSVGKPLEPSPLAITRPPPPCLPPPTLLPPPPPPLSLPVHPSFSEPSILAQSVTQHQQQQQQQRQRELAEKYMRPYFDLRGKTAFDIPHQAHLPLFAPHPFYPPPPPPPPPMAKFQPLFVKEPEQTEALPLVVSTPKKKRTKVTDTRLSPRAARAMLQDSLGPQHHQNHHQHQHQHHPQQQQQQQHPDGHHHHHHGGGPQASSHRNGGDSSSRKSSFPHHHHPHHLHHFSALGGIHEAFPHPSMLSIGLPTSVAIHNPSLQHSDLLQTMYPLPPPPPQQQQQRGGLGGHRDGQVMGHQVVGGSKRSGSDSPDLVNSPNSLLKCDSDAYEQAMVDSMMNYDGLNLTSTLTPMHLRKAKLMFFYVRYPSSAILKIYFPDVKFNKNNTAQLVKWFSNFREFYYIQMEKYARQALAEGLKNVTDLVITADSELYRVLVLHYNRNNQIEVPENFRFVVQATLREFFISIAAEKDQEQSWKKSIYKVIARMDDAVPEYFKSSNWMEQLADG